MRILSGHFFLILLAGLLVTASAFHSAAAESLKCSALSELPDCAWQKTASFPDWKNYTDPAPISQMEQINPAPILRLPRHLPIPVNRPVPQGPY